MKWRLVKFSKNSAFMNMSIDEAILEMVRDGLSPPTIRLYGWSPDAVSIGCFQSMEEEVNVKRCMELGVDCVRRITGGGAVYHDSEGELTYSIIAREDLFPKGIRESYREICGYVVRGLGKIGISAEFAPINDIVTHGKKISGNAQTRREGVLLQHGTILYSLDVKKMFGVLNVSKEKISDKMIKNVEERVTSVRSYSDASIEKLCESIETAFTEGREYDIGRVSNEELSKANGLAKNKYGSRDWNFRR